MTNDERKIRIIDEQNGGSCFNRAGKYSSLQMYNKATIKMNRKRI